LLRTGAMTVRRQLGLERLDLAEQRLDQVPRFGQR
jgi:hypothetical protein